MAGVWQNPEAQLLMGALYKTVQGKQIHRDPPSPPGTHLDRPSEGPTNTM
jgi:hypothetical protein